MSLDAAGHGALRHDVAGRAVEPEGKPKPYRYLNNSV
ncbi:hypothetical protein FRAHR75_1000006 [Frankia sp. Hr75.2]|nr:hypothetical protein FRAHR75_1000006 [Frankia sp. Hr75.2]